MDKLQTILEVHSKKVHFVAIGALDVPVYRAPSGHICVDITDFRSEFPEDLSSWHGE